MQYQAAQTRQRSTGDLAGKDGSEGRQRRHQIPDGQDSSGCTQSGRETPTPSLQSVCGNRQAKGWLKRIDATGARTVRQVLRSV